MPELTLYSMPSSGNSYKVRLLLALQSRQYIHYSAEYETAALDNAKADGKLPLGKLPALQLPSDDILPESNAILFWLGDGTDWVPSDPLERARMLGWMFFEQNRHETVIAVRAALQKYVSRAHLATPDRMAKLLQSGHEILGIMDDALAGRDWLVGERPSIADIALYAYTHTAGSLGGYDLDRFANVTRWCASIAALPGYVALDDIPE